MKVYVGVYNAPGEGQFFEGNAFSTIEKAEEWVRFRNNKPQLHSDRYGYEEVDLDGEDYD